MAKIYLSNFVFAETFTSVAQNHMEIVTVSRPADDIALLTLDMPGSGANVLNAQLFQELDRAMADLADQQDLAGVVLYSAKPSIFVAGADLNHIVANLDFPDKEIVKFCEQGRAVMARFSRCPFVSIAAIHGACVGGGLELALWCDLRIASDHRRTVLGLPEVKLGLVPGWAGTARLPRISGLGNAVDLVTSGRLVSAAEAKAMKFVDAVVAQDALIDEAVSMIRRVRTSEAFITDRKRIMGPVAGFDSEDVESQDAQVKEVVTRYGTAIVENHEVFHYAPTVALEHMTRTASMGIKAAWDSESLAMAQVWGSPASRGLLNQFFLTDRNKKQPGMVDLTIEPQSISRLGIVGAGLMGRAIAASCLKAGLDVTLLDADQAALDIAQQTLHATKSALVITSDYAALQGVDLVIESVVEIQDVKQQVIQKIESVVAPETIIASNTSAIPIEKLAAKMQHSQRMCGVHFCHPELMSLVEVVCGPDSSEATIASVVAFVRGLRKMPVAINDGPGFVVNRILAAMIDEAVRLFRLGVDIEVIDEAMVDFGFLGGPFQIIDVIGVDTCMYAGRTMLEAGLPCVSLSPVLPRLVKAGLLGRKSTKGGFYRYDADGEAAKLNPDSARLIADYRNADPVTLNAKAIAHRIVASMALEATRILEEAMVADPRDIDLCVIHGFSFPAHQGGVLFWSDQQSWLHVKRTLYQINEVEPRMEPSETIKRLANEQKTVYGSMIE